MTPVPPQATIDLDAAPLDDACDFYRRLLGFRVVRTDNAGTFNEARTLLSDQVPALQLRLRRCDPRPVVGAAIGTIRLITFYVNDPAGVAARIDNPVWVLPPPEHAPAERVILQDSSGYHVALARPPGDSACSDANPPGRASSTDPAATS